MAHNVVVENDNQRESNIMLSAKQFEQLLKLLPVQKVETHNLDSPFSGMAICNTVTVGSVAGAWIIESGATDPMTATLSLLSNVTEVSNHQLIMLPTGDTAVITHRGDVILKNGMKLTGVLYVPKFNHNLLSIHKLAQDNDFQVMFYPEKCVLMESVTNEVRGIGLLNNGLYYLECPGVSKECNQVVIQYGSSDYEVWHNRIGHASQSKIMSIPEVKSQISEVPTHVCVTYPMVRFTNLSYNSSSSHVVSLCSLVHANIWGPYKVPTRNKYKYFLTLVDDSSRMVWVYLLKFKSDFMQTLKAFYAYVTTQFDCQIKVLRTDNALEFKDKPCNEFYADKVILHQTSIAYKPQ